MNQPELREALASSAKDELARRRLLDFAALVHPRWQSPPHIKYLAEMLEGVERGEIQRLAISAPPGHGKSWLLQTFVAWFLGRDPRRRVLAISASESLAKRNSRDAQGLVTHDAWPFADCTLQTDSVLDWGTNAGGSVKAIGKGGTVSGFRAELVVVDDLQGDAGSDTTRTADYEWFQGVLTTRLEPDGACIIIQTRWHDADIIGSLTESEAASQWRFVNLAAIADGNDPLKRNRGEVLWGERWPREKLEAKKAEVGSSAFASLYQGDPVPAGGLLFKPEWFEHRYDSLPTSCVSLRNTEQTLYGGLGFAVGSRAVPIASPLIVVQAIDTAAKAGVSNDRSAVLTVATDLANFYVIDCWADRVNYTDLKRIAVQLYEKHRPRAVYIESASSGIALLDDLRASTALPIVPVTVADSKISRAESVTALWESGRVKLPRSAPWIDNFLSEHLRFPSARHDDRVDAMAHALIAARTIADRAIAIEHYQTQVSKVGGWMAR